MGYYSGSYSHLNIALLRRELRKTENNINIIDTTIASHEEKIAGYKNELDKYGRRIFPNDGAMRSCSKSINNYNWAIERLKKDKKKLEDKRDALLLELDIKKKRRSAKIKCGILITIVIGGFVLLNGEGEIKAEVKETSSISKTNEDNIKDQSSKLTSNLDNVEDAGIDNLDKISLQLEEYFKHLKEKGEEKLEEKKYEFENAEFWDKTLGEICEDAINNLLEPSREESLESSEFTK